MSTIVHAIVVNDETGEFVMVDKITRVIVCSGPKYKSVVFVQVDSSSSGSSAYAEHCCVYSPLTPREIMERL